MFSRSKKIEIQEYLSKTDGNIYIGCDSVAYRRFCLKTQCYENWARFAVVLVVHIDNRHGCKIFSYLESERVYGARLEKPSLRLMSEVYKSVECFLELSELLLERYVEIHLDVNPSELHASNAIAKQAVGYVKGMTNLDALIKPDAWAGSNTADHVARFGEMRNGRT